MAFDYFGKLKASPLLMASLFVAIIGVIILAFGFIKGKKWAKWLGGGLAAGGGIGHVGIIVWDYFKPPIAPTARQPFVSGIGMAGQPGVGMATTPE